MDKNKKKTLTISSNLKKKIDTSSISSSGKKSFSVEKKKPFRPNKSFSKTTSNPSLNTNIDTKKKNYDIVLYTNSGDRNYASENWESALDAYDKALKLDPQICKES